MSSPQADGYSEGILCEHDFLVGPSCGEPAVRVFRGVARCAEHFERFVASHAWKYHADIRLEAQEV